MVRDDHLKEGTLELRLGPQGARSVKTGVLKSQVKVTASIEAPRLEGKERLPVLST